MPSNTAVAIRKADAGVVCDRCHLSTGVTTFIAVHEWSDRDAPGSADAMHLCVVCLVEAIGAVTKPDLDAAMNRWGATSGRPFKRQYIPRF